MFKAHRRLHHSTLGLRIIKKKKKKWGGDVVVVLEEPTPGYSRSPFAVRRVGGGGGGCKSKSGKSRALPTETKVESGDVSKQKWNLC